MPHPELKAVALFYAMADGGFADPVLLPAPAGPGEIAVGDVDGDGKPDLVYAARGVYLRRNQGGGSFGDEEWQATARQYFPALALADLDADGFPDLVLSDPSGLFGPVEVLMNDGRGHFTSAGLLVAGWIRTHAAVGDLDSDGKPDIAVANWMDGTVSLFRGRGDGTFAAPTTLATGPYPVAVAIGDVTRDGLPDLVVACEGDFMGTAKPVVRIFPGTAGGLGPPVDVDPGDLPLGLALRDMDSDGRSDLVIGCSGGLVILRALPGGGFAAPASYNAGLVDSFAVIDLDGDLRPDVIVSDWDGKVAVLRNRCLPW